MLRLVDAMERPEAELLASEHAHDLAGTRETPAREPRLTDTTTPQAASPAERLQTLGEWGRDDDRDLGRRWPDLPGRGR